jgi:hypothetical protein
MDYQGIGCLLDTFISMRDTSLKVANQLEVLIDDGFPDDDYLQETVEMLACYRPEGGESILGADVIRERLVGVREYLARQVS